MQKITPDKIHESIGIPKFTGTASAKVSDALWKCDLATGIHFNDHITYLGKNIVTVSPYGKLSDNESSFISGFLRAKGFKVEKLKLDGFIYNESATDYLIYPDNIIYRD